MEKVHIVKEGECLMGIALDYNLKIGELMRMNNMPDPAPIPRVGQAIVVETDSLVLTPREVEALEEAIDYMEPQCWFDHHGYCQSHGLSDDCFVPYLVAALDRAKPE